MHGDVDVELGELGPDLADRVGAHRVALVVRQQSPRLAPVVVHRQLVETGVGQWEEQLDALVVTVVRDVLDLGAGEREPPIARAHLLHAPDDGCEEDEDRVGSLFTKARHR